MTRSLLPGFLLLSALSRLVILVHKIIVVAQIVIVNCNVAQPLGDGLLWRSFEILDKIFEPG